jgi:hypothetical protein
MPVSKIHIQPSVKWTQGNIRVSYELSNPEMLDIAKDFPPYLAAIPSQGDVVEATDGTRMEIKEIVHTVEHGLATLKLVIGRNLGGQSETGGGAGDLIVGEME